MIRTSTTPVLRSRYGAGTPCGHWQISLGFTWGKFILCETPPLRLEKRGPLLIAEEAKERDWEEEEELIKVFIANEEEPKSLVDIPYSLISKCANLFFQSFRLYVVYEGSDKEDVIGQLKRKVGDWDKS